MTAIPYFRDYSPVDLITMPAPSMGDKLLTVFPPYTQIIWWAAIKWKNYLASAD
jgi:hypothetical protein